MRKRVYIALAVLLVMLAGVIAWQVFQASRERQPVYGGKPLTLWLRTYAPSSSSGLHSPEWNEADDAVRHMGTNCIPILLRMIRQKDSPVKLWLIAFAQKHGLTKRIHFVPAAVRNVEASRAFIALGDMAKDAVPALVKMYDDNDHRRVAERDRGRFGLDRSSREARDPVAYESRDQFKSEGAGERFMGIG